MVTERCSVPGMACVQPGCKKAVDPERGSGLWGEMARCEMAGSVQLIMLLLPVSKWNPVAERDQVCFY